MQECCWKKIDEAKRIGRCNYICSECDANVSILWFLYMECVAETKESTVLDGESLKVAAKIHKDFGRVIKKLGKT